MEAELSDIKNVTYSGSCSRHPCGKPEPFVKVYFDDVPGGEIHETEPQASDDPDTGIEDEDGGLGGQVDVKSGNKEPKGGDGDAEDSDEAMAQPRGE